MTKVLIVEDENALRDILEQLFVGGGHQVAVARNEREALSILKREDGWLMLLDMMLPEMSGLEVIRRLEENPTLADGNKIIAMSVEEAFFCSANDKAQEALFTNC